MSDYYDEEAPVYDESRGGTPRARAAAEAVLSLVPPEGTCLDLAGGTGIVGAELAARGLAVFVADVSMGMLRLANDRLPGRVIAAEAGRLPIRDGSVDLVTAIWLLHLLPVQEADRVIVEAARVLRPGGHFATTVDKDLAHGRDRRTNGDHRDRVEHVARGHGMSFLAAAAFSGPSTWGSATDADPVFPVLALRR